MKKIILLCFVVVFSLFLLSCVPAEKKCNSNSDCVQATCCHASDAVNREHGPDCSGRMCTSVCQPGTIDCGQGEIKCVSGECKAVIHID